MKEQEMADSLMQNAKHLSDMGFLNGKAGIILYFYYWGRHEKKEIFSDYASELLDSLIDSFHVGMPIGFENGITGIGWVIEHLIQNGFVEADADEVFEDIDQEVIYKLILDENDLDVVVAIGFYLVGRLCYRRNDDSNCRVLDLKYYMILLIDELEKQIEWNGGSDNVAYLLEEIHNLDIFNFKVEKLQNIIGKSNINYLFPMIPRMNRMEVEAKLARVDEQSIYSGLDLTDVVESERWGLRNGIAGIAFHKMILAYEL